MTIEMTMMTVVMISAFIPFFFGAIVLAAEYVKGSLCMIDIKYRGLNIMLVGVIASVVTVATAGFVDSQDSQDTGEQTFTVENVGGEVSIYEGVLMAETKGWVIFTDPDTGEESSIPKERIHTMSIKAKPVALQATEGTIAIHEEAHASMMKGLDGRSAGKQEGDV